jgi:hypothetical protein
VLHTRNVGLIIQTEHNLAKEESLHAGRSEPAGLGSMPLKIEAPPCHFAGVVSRQTSPANVRSHCVDRACRRNAYASHKRCTAITTASHASMLAIDIRAGDSIEIGITFQ